MRRRIWFRPLSALLALWLPLIIGEPRVFMPCPVHSVREHVAAMANSHMAHDEVAGTHLAAAHHGDHAPSKGHNCCNCIDGCCASVALTAPKAEALAAVVIAYAEHGSLPSIQSFARPAPEYARPYTTGPPRA